MKNITSVAAFARLSLKFSTKISRKSHQFAVTCFINNGIEWAKVIACTSGPVHTTPDKFENATITDHFGFVFEENSVREVTRYL